MRALALLLAGAASAAQAAPTATLAPLGTTSDGKAVQVATLRNDKGMIARIADRGGTILEVTAPDRNGRMENVVIGQPDVSTWGERAGPFNTLIGRFANRIGGGGFTLDGKRYDIAGANPQGVILHGGRGGLSAKTWKAETFQRADAAGVVLSVVSPDGENGFPGELTVQVTYTLDNEGALTLAYEATTTKPTVVNLTNHTYFKLGGPLSGTIYDQLLTVNASRYTPTDADQVPTGELASVAGTPFDFRKPTRIVDRVYSTHPQMMIARGIDHNFVIDGQGLRTAAVLVEPVSGRRLEVRTTQPGVHVYSANHFNGSQIGANGRTVRQGDGMAFETQHFPDSPNKREFPSTVLRPGETLRETTQFRFSVDRGTR